MLGIVAEIPFLALIGAALVAALAGFVKGAVGFAMPMVMIAGLGSFLPGEVALAALIIPTLLTNAMQASRQGWRAAWDAALRFRLYLGILLICLAASAQLVRSLPQDAFFLIVGLPVTLFALVQLFGLRLHLKPQHRAAGEVVIGGIAGFIGGISGVWGPPTVTFLTAIGTEKGEQMRAQGVIYGLGAVALLLAHLRSGVVNAHTVPLSGFLLVPAVIGMWIGLRWHDRLPQQGFRRATLVVLVVAGVNLIRRGLMV